MPSTAIRQFSYDHVSHTLFVTFIDGDLYAYSGVDPQVYSNMRRATSKGRFFAYKVRNRYPYRKIPRELASPGRSDGRASPPPAGAGR